MLKDGALPKNHPSAQCSNVQREPTSLQRCNCSSVELRVSWHRPAERVIMEDNQLPILRLLSKHPNASVSWLQADVLGSLSMASELQDTSLLDTSHSR